jgi:hypothetical protein
MEKQFATVLVTYPVAFLPGLNGKARGNAPLKFAQKISMPSIQGRMDHVTLGIKGKRLFVPAYGDNQNTAEVIDRNSGINNGL